MPRCRSLLAVPLILLAAAAPAGAEEVLIGSDLKADATFAYSDGNDWSAWNTELASGGLVKAPVQGEVNVVNLKGRMILEGRAQQPPDVVMHVMVLRPQDNGSVAVVPGGVSENLPLPIGSDPNQINTYTRAQLTKPDGADGKGGTRLCIEKGDYLAFTTSGGFGGFAKDNPEQTYVHGAQFQVFGATRSISMFHNQGGAYDFQPFRGGENGGREVLMNATIGTRENARYTCRTEAEKRENLDYKPVTAEPGTTTPGTPAAPGSATLAASEAAIPKPRRAPKVRGKRVRISLLCPGPGACGGKLALRSYTARAASFALAPGQRANVTLELNQAARRKLRKKGAGLTVKAMVTHADGSHTTRRFVIRRR